MHDVVVAPPERHASSLKVP
jgi:hypothetical protein